MMIRVKWMPGLSTDPVLPEEVEIPGSLWDDAVPKWLFETFQRNIYHWILLK